MKSSSELVGISECYQQTLPLITQTDIWDELNHHQSLSQILGISQQSHVLWQVTDNKLQHRGIQAGSLVLVNIKLPASDQDIVLAMLDETIYIRELDLKHQQLIGAQSEPIKLEHCSNCQIIGVVERCISVV